MIKNHNMKVGILGSTGFIGNLVLQYAIQQNLKLKVLVRNKDKLKIQNEHIEVIEGSILDQIQMNAFTKDCDAIISGLGGLKGDDQYQLFKKATDILINSMERNGIKKLISINGAACVLPDEKIDFKRRLIKLMVSLINKPGLEAKKGEIEVLLKNKQINWVSPRVAMIIKKTGFGKLLADDKKLPGGKIYQTDIAKFMVDQLYTDKWHHRAPYIASNMKK